MEPITNLLKRYINLTPPHESIRKDLMAILADVCGVGISLKDIVYRRNIIYLNVSPAKKSVIFVNKKKILERLKEKSQKTVLDVR